MKTEYDHEIPQSQTDPWAPLERIPTLTHTFYFAKYIFIYVLSVFKKTFSYFNQKTKCVIIMGGSGVGEQEVPPEKSQKFRVSSQYWSGSPEKSQSNQSS